MPHVQLTQKGFEKYCGVLGDSSFTDGVSDENISRSEARRLSAIMSMEEVETGRSPSETQEMVDERNYTVEEMEKGRVAKAKRDAEQDVEDAEKGVDAAKEKVVELKKDAEQTSKKVEFDYTQKDLEAIADAGGMKGLREFAYQYDVRGGSIVDLMKSLMALKAKADAEAKAKAEKTGATED